MKRALAVTAFGALLAAHNAAGAESTPASPASPRTPQTQRQTVPAEGAWGNTPAAQNSVKLAEPAADVGTRRNVDHKHEARTTGRPRTRALPTAESPGCMSLPAKWDRAERFAGTGHPEQAYATYLQLLHTCPAGPELEGTAWKAANALPAAYVDRLLADPAFELPTLHKIRTDIELQRMYAANTAGRYEDALAYSRALRADRSVALDAAALETSGWLEEKTRDDATAERLFREALKSAKDPAPAHFGLALALMHQGRLDEAEAESRALTTPQGRRLHAQIALERAKASGDPAEVDAALKLIDETGGARDAATRSMIGWAMLASKRPMQAEEIFRTLHREAPENDEYAQGLAFSSAAAHDYAALDALVAENGSRAPVAARQMLAEHDERLGLDARARSLAGHPIEGHEAALQSLFSLDRKSGTQGQDKLTVWTIPQLSATLLPTPSLSLRLDAAVLRLDDGQHRAWGKLFAAAARTDWDEGELVAGAAIETPGHGPTQVLGKIQYGRVAENEQSFVRLTATRDSIYDSLRAYEGSPSGSGPAVSSSLEIAAREPIGRTAWYVGETLGGGAVTATNTAFNPFYAASLALTRDFSAKGWSWLNAGPEIRLSSYRYDANRFDGPYAGYWSPKSNREAGLVFNAQTAEDHRFLFKTGGRIGYATRELFTGRASGVFGEDTTSLAVLMAPNLIVGAGVGYRASPGYEDVNVFAWIKIPFDARSHLRAADLVTPRGF